MTKTARSDSILFEPDDQHGYAELISVSGKTELTALDSLLLDHIGIGVIMVDSKGHIIRANRRTETLLGIESDLVAPGEPYNRLQQKIVALGQTGPCDIHVPNGHVLELKTTILPNGGFLQTLTDVGEDRRLREKLHRLATTDPLTGVSNRRHFMTRSQYELDRTKRYSSQSALMILDLDHFKKVNDTYGHAIGDTTLKIVSEAVMSSLRKVDEFGRLGGEEFGILLPETDIETAAIVAERLRQSIAARPICETPAGTVFVTASIGVTMIRLDDEETQIFFERADMALYQAKAQGRNKVVTNL